MAAWVKTISSKWKIPLIQRHPEVTKGILHEPKMELRTLRECYLWLCSGQSLLSCSHQKFFSFQNSTLYSKHGQTSFWKSTIKAQLFFRILVLSILENFSTPVQGLSLTKERRKNIVQSFTLYVPEWDNYLIYHTSSSVHSPPGPWKEVEERPWNRQGGSPTIIVTHSHCDLEGFRKHGNWLMRNLNLNLGPDSNELFMILDLFPRRSLSSTMK